MFGINLIKELLSVFLNNINFFTITLLMTIESSVIPFPSEIIMIPAGYLVYEGKLNFLLVVFAGTLGSVIGALFNYFLGLWLGKSKIVTKYKKILFINEKHLEKAEKFFKKHGKKTMFFGRLIPVIRQYISVPAGFTKMDLKEFILFTALGAMFWCAFLTALGYFLGITIAQNVIFLFNQIFYLVIALLIAFIIGFLLYNFLKKRKH